MDGVRLREEILRRLRAEVAAGGGGPVRLATVVVGEDPQGGAYASHKHRAAARSGVRTVVVRLPEASGQAEVEDAVGRLGADPGVHGVVVQLPLPAGLDSTAVLDMVPLDKDVNGMAAGSLSRLTRGEQGFVPAAALAVVRLLFRYGVPTQEQDVVVLSASEQVSRPLELLMACPEVGAAVTLISTSSPSSSVSPGGAGAADPAGEPGEAARRRCAEAGILVVHLGRPGVIGPEWVRPGAAVVDVGVTRTPAGLRGDVDFEAVRAKAGAITPNPGGIGPVMVACLLRNTVEAARRLGALRVPSLGDPDKPGPAGGAAS